LRDNDDTANLLHSIAPLPKLLTSVLVFTAAIAVSQLQYLGGLVCLEIILILYAMPWGQAKGIIIGMAICAVFVGSLQYLFLPWSEVLLIVLRMMAMALIFPPMLATMRMRDLRDTLVYQLKIPYDYAFMFTTALRYVPDLLNDAHYIMEAQSCRGCDFKHGNPWQRIKRYMAILAPLVMHGLNKAETLAMSMELRGYGISAVKPATVQPLRSIDVAVSAAMIVAFAVFVGFGKA